MAIEAGSRVMVMRVYAFNLMEPNPIGEVDVVAVNPSGQKVCGVDFGHDYASMLSGHLLELPTTKKEG